MLIITEAAIAAFSAFLVEREYSPATVAKYSHDAYLLLAYAPAGIADKAQLVGFRAHLEQRGYSGASVNSMLGAVNLFLAFLCSEWKFKYVRVQRKAFLPADKELTQAEYERMVRAADDPATARGDAIDWAMEYAKERARSVALLPTDEYGA